MFYSVIYIPTIVQSLLHTFSTWFLLEANINVLFCNMLPSIVQICYIVSQHDFLKDNIIVLLCNNLTELAT